MQRFLGVQQQSGQNRRLRTARPVVAQDVTVVPDLCTSVSECTITQCLASDCSCCRTLILGLWISSVLGEPINTVAPDAHHDLFQLFGAGISISLDHHRIELDSAKNAQARQFL